jgi:tripartite-type tricarboxylate transporter receptor subunit TctC
MARLVGDRLSETWGQPVIVDMRSGAGGIIGTEIAARAAPDGYTIVIVVTSHAINASLGRKTSYDPIKDFAPVARLGYTPLVLVVHPSLPVNSVSALIALAKEKPQQLNYASAGSGSGLHLAAELFKAMSGIDIVHVAYKGATPAEVDLIAGRVSIMFDNIVNAIPPVRAGRLKALAVTSDKRSVLLPDVPTVDEAGLRGYEYTGWFAALAPAGTPKVIVDKLSIEIGKILGRPDVKQPLSELGFEPAPSTPEQLGQYLRSQVAKWRRVVSAAGVRIE